MNWVANAIRRGRQDEAREKWVTQNRAPNYPTKTPPAKRKTNNRRKNKAARVARRKGRQ